MKGEINVAYINDAGVPRNIDAGPIVITSKSEKAVSIFTHFYIEYKLLQLPETLI